ncbi:MAG: dihydropteroate synthase [Bacteroidota bacterium]
MEWTFRRRDELTTLALPCVMGILNITSDSFYDPSRVVQESQIIEKCRLMIADGATIIDIGGQSTRPGAQLVDEETEIQRVEQAIRAIRKEFPAILISVDTFRSVVLKAAHGAGADICNDVSAGMLDPLLIPTVAELGMPYILMHMRGTPETMQQSIFEGNIVTEVYRFFTEKIALLHAAGISDIALDPGFGFGKSLEQNYQLLNRLSDFATLGKPVLAGVSRKSMIQKVIGQNAEGALNGTTAVHCLALSRGAGILRVHDVKEAVEAVKIVSFTASCM